MKILVFSWKDRKHPWAGGSEVNIHEQARRWVDEGHEVTMFTSRPRGQARRDTLDGMSVHRAGNRFTVFLLAPLYYLLRLRDRADVILAIINGIPFPVPLFSSKPRVALIHHLHRNMFLIEMGSVFGQVGRLIERYLVPLLYLHTPFISVSHSTARTMREWMFRGDRLDIEVVHNGIDLKRYGPGEEKFEKPTTLYLGRLKKYKRVPLLISMMGRVRAEIPDAELVIAGDGDAMDEVRSMVSRPGVGDYVKLLGYVDWEQKLSLYRRSWILATPSGDEGWGLTVIEANACGTPAVAFDVPGLNESIVDGKTGLLARDEDGFVSNLVRLLGDPDLRRTMECEAVEWAGRFDWDETALRTLAVLSRAAGLES